MERPFYLLSKFFIAMSCLIFTACQAQPVRPLQSTAPEQDPDPRTAPLVNISFDGFDPETTVLRFSEGQTVTFQLDTVGSSITNASLTQTSGPAVNFGEVTAGGMSASDGDIMNGDGMDDVTFVLQDVEGPRTAVFPSFQRLNAEFVMPSVTSRTTINFRFQSSSPSESRTRFIPIIIEDDAGAITLTGQVSKGLISNTRVELFSVDSFLDDLLGGRQIVEPVQIDGTGTYSFTLLPAIDFEELLIYVIEGDGADMVCDAPQGCNTVAFGETFEVQEDLDLRAYIAVPQLGTTQIVNVNVLTTMAARRAQELAGPFSRVNPRDVARGREDVARFFALPDQNFTQVPFVDVTRPITSTDENAIRVAMLSGGILGAAFAQSDPDDPDDFLEELDDFVRGFDEGEIECQDSPTQTTISLEDVTRSALELAEINGSAQTQEFFRLRLAGIRSGIVRCDIPER